MANIVAIEDPADPRIAAYRDIRERDLTGRDGLFVAEGKVVVEKLLSSASHSPFSLLVAAHRLEHLAPLLEQVAEGVPVFAAAQPVLNAITGFDIHRGIIAIGRRENPPSADALLTGLGEGATVLLLSAIANHDNMGGIFRNAAALGADAILLDSDCCDPLYRKAIRVSVGAALLVPWAKLGRGEDGLALLERHGFHCFALSPEGASSLSALSPPPRTAILLGAEGPGLDPALLARAKSIRIPMAAGFDSLNVATTSGIVLHHIAAARGAV